MAIWSEYLTSIAGALGVTPTQAGMIFSLVFTIGLLVVALISTKGRKPELTLTLSALFSTMLFTGMGWYPVWVGSVLALVVALLFIMFIKGKG